MIYTVCNGIWIGLQGWMGDGEYSFCIFLENSRMQYSSVLQWLSMWLFGIQNMRQSWLQKKSKFLSWFYIVS